MERLEVLGRGEYGYKDQALILKLSCGREAPLEASPTLGEQSKVYLGHRFAKVNLLGEHEDMHVSEPHCVKLSWEQMMPAPSQVTPHYPKSVL